MCDYLKRNETKDPMDMNNDERRQFVQNAVAKCERKLKTYIRSVLTYNTSLSREEARNLIKKYVEIIKEKQCSRDFK